MNKIFDLLNQNWGNNRGYDWLQANNIMKTDYRNGQMDGNNCKMLLEKLHLLKTQVPKRLQKYVAALEMFNLVRISCFGQELIPGYEKHIVNFKKAYEKLGVPMTNKVHVLVAHVADFCKKTGKGLGFFSEQAR